jgi:hypothetical protein
MDGIDREAAYKVEVFPVFLQCWCTKLCQIYSLKNRRQNIVGPVKCYVTIPVKWCKINKVNLAL